MTRSETAGLGGGHGSRSPVPGPRVVVFGYAAMGCLGLDALLRHGFEVVALVSHRDDPHEEIWWQSVAARAEAAAIPVYYPDKGELKLSGVADTLATFRPDMIFSFYYRYMIPTRVLALAPGGAFNLHGSLLPRYRGRAPVNWVLANGECETGVSVHAMVAKPDAGDLVDQERVEIAHEDTAFTLFCKLERAATVMLDRALPRLRAGTAVLTPMDLSQGSYFGARTPADGELDWRWPAERNYNLVRAVTHPYPGAFASLGGRRVMVWWALPVECSEEVASGTVLAIDREGVTVRTGDGALRLVTVQVVGQPELPAGAWAVADGLAVGVRFDESGVQE
jgi:methionyl-tRNA formyltransferase